MEKARRTIENRFPALDKEGLEVVGYRNGGLAQMSIMSENLSCKNALATAVTAIHNKQTQNL